MPRKGWKVITVPESVYDYFWDSWEKNKEDYRLKYGITSFTGFVSKHLYELMEKEKKEMKVVVREGTKG